MTKAEFKKRATAILKKAGVTKIDVYVDRPIATGERTFGAAATYRGEAYELTMVHGEMDTVWMERLLHAIEQFPGDVDRVKGGQPRRRARAAGGHR